MKSIAIVLITFLCILYSSISAQICEDDNWDGRFFRPEQISASKVAAANGKVYIAGTYMEPYDQGGGSRGIRQVAGVITFDGTSWNFPPYGQGLNGGGFSWSFSDIMVLGNDVIVAGNFKQTNDGDTTIKYIARWDGTQWWPLGGGVNNTVHALTTTGNFDVYAGGQFTRIGTDTAHYVARWTSGSGWEPLMDPSNTQQGTSHPVQALTIYNNRLVMGGAFTNVASGIPANHLAEWNWTTKAWDEFGGGSSSNVSMLATGVNGVYAADIPDAGGVTITGVALWNGSLWTDLATPGIANIADIDVINGGDLIACGSYLDNPPDQFNRRIAKYNSLTSQWEDLLSSCNLETGVTDIDIDGSTIYAVTGHSFGATYACNSAIGTVSRFDGVGWRGFGEGMTTNGAWGTALYATDTAVYVGGILGHLGGVGIHNGIGRWSNADERWYNFTMNGTTGLKYSGFDATIWDVHEINGDVYIAGQFSNAGSISTRGICRWDGTDFHPLAGGTDVSSIVYDVEPFMGNIYIGGTIFNVTQPDNSTPNLGGFIRWNGTQYERPTGSALNSVFTLEDAGSKIYIGGQFIAGSQTPTSYIVSYDGTVFDSVGGGTNGRVLDIEVSGNDVYAAGGFLSVKNPDGNQVNAQRLARWNGNSWEALGQFNDTVRAIYLRGSEIYAAGHFTMVDGVEARHIAYFDGSSWNSIGEGTDGEITINNGEIYELGSDGSYLWMTGRFSHAGGNPSQNVARWKFCTDPPPTFIGGGTGANVTGTNVTISWDAFGGKSAATTYDLQVATDGNFTTVDEDVTGITGTSHVVTNLSENSDYFWRVRAVPDMSVGAWSARQTFTTGVATGIEELNNLLPESYTLLQNYPNPFNPSTQIEFSLPEKTHVSIKIYNLLGETVTTLVNNSMTAGNYVVDWNGTNNSGKRVASGVYIYKLVTENFTDTKKMLLLK